MKKTLVRFCILSGILVISSNAQAFCGFYVAKADTKLFNRASKVVLVRDDDRSVITMSNDFQGDVKEFAIVVPVPTVLQRNQINVGVQANIDHLDAYTAPRLVEYFDPDPCAPRVMYEALAGAVQSKSDRLEKKQRAKKLGVTIEAQYTVGEYDILILSAKQSDGLSIWLQENQYKLPQGAAQVLSSYIKQDMKFFVARVNLEEHSKLGFKNLRPLQMAFNSKKFMLPIRLGTLNADGAQELFVFALTRKGRVESTNYRTVKLPTGTEVPLFVKTDFGNFYKDMFSRQVDQEKQKAVFLEYAWDMNWCDPCAADPLSPEQLRQLGAFWVGAQQQSGYKAQARNVYVTRLHLRYSAETFPDDLKFQVTGNRENYQGRYVIRHPWKGSAARCEAAKGYLEQLNARQEQQSQNLARLTGWDISKIRNKIQWPSQPVSQTTPQKPSDSWWNNLWK